jgi:farnesyl-diphosphate farnesyltransferase
MNAPLRELLKQTSRTFHKTLRILPSAVRPQISLAYLLARTTDTIADTELVPVEQRLQALQKLRERIQGTGNAPLNFGELARQQASPAERLLLENVESTLTELRRLSDPDLRLVRTVLDTITSGQELDLRRFATVESALQRAGKKPSAEPQPVIALQTDAELDDYTYRVAGCVGEFWTDMCIQHLFRLPELEDLMWSSEFKNLGVRFGKGLQLVNILRDLPADLRKGRCYLPAEKLEKAGLKPADLLSPTNEARLRPLYHSYLDIARSHLAAGWQYTNLIPFTWMSVRLACAWPILIGVKTIARLRAASVLDASQRIKISRSEVRGIAVRSIVLYPFPRAWKRQFQRPAPGEGKDVA